MSKRVKITFESVNAGKYTIIPKHLIAETNARVRKEMQLFNLKLRGLNSKRKPIPPTLVDEDKKITTFGEVEDGKSFFYDGLKLFKFGKHGRGRDNGVDVVKIILDNTIVQVLQKPHFFSVGTSGLTCAECGKVESNFLHFRSAESIKKAQQKINEKV